MQGSTFPTISRLVAELDGEVTGGKSLYNICTERGMSWEHPKYWRDKQFGYTKYEGGGEGVEVVFVGTRHYKDATERRDSFFLTSKLEVTFKERNAEPDLYLEIRRKEREMGPVVLQMFSRTRKTSYPIWGYPDPDKRVGFEGELWKYIDRGRVDRDWPIVNFFQGRETGAMFITITAFEMGLVEGQDLRGRFPDLVETWLKFHKGLLHRYQNN